MTVKSIAPFPSGFRCGACGKRVSGMGALHKAIKHAAKCPDVKKRAEERRLRLGGNNDGNTIQG